MQIEDTELPGVKLIVPHRFGDQRGWFSETWQREKLAVAGVEHDFMQDNHSLSVAQYTLRGLHYQAPPFAQTKLVRVARGRVLDVAVDARKGSPHYLKWVGVELTAEYGEQLLIPKGFLHAFLTLEPNCEVLYKVDAPYSGEADGAVRFDDPEIGVDWGVAAEEISLSEKDESAPRVSDWDNPFEYSE